MNRKDIFFRGRSRWWAHSDPLWRDVTERGEQIGKGLDGWGPIVATLIERLQKRDDPSTFVALSPRLFRRPFLGKLLWRKSLPGHGGLRL